MGILEHVKGAAKSTAKAVARAARLPIDPTSPKALRTKRTRKKKGEPEPPKVPTCGCGKELDWRDVAYGHNGLCKRCTRQNERNALRGRFIPTAVYVQQLAQRNSQKDVPLRFAPNRQQRRHAQKVTLTTGRRRNAA